MFGFLSVKPSQFVALLHAFKYTTEENMIFFKKRFELGIKLSSFAFFNDFYRRKMIFYKKLSLTQFY